MFPCISDLRVIDLHIPSTTCSAIGNLVNVSSPKLVHHQSVEDDPTRRCMPHCFWAGNVYEYEVWVHALDMILRICLDHV